MTDPLGATEAEIVAAADVIRAGFLAFVADAKAEIIYRWPHMLEGQALRAIEIGFASCYGEVALAFVAPEGEA